MEPHVSLPHLAAVLVGDARKGVLYVNHGDAVLLDLRVEEVIEAPANPPTREQGTDRPGRAGSGDHKSAVEDTDWHAAAEAEFAANLANHLNQRHERDAFKGLVIVAPPRFLGDLRKHFSPALKASVSAEWTKDLVHDSATEIERLFAPK